MSEPALLALEGVWARYGGGAGRRAAAADERAAPLCGVDLALVPGELCAVLGPNGAGKTTLVRVAAGLLRPERGVVRLGGAPLESLDRRRVAQQVAVLAQRCDTPSGFSVRDVVAMGRAPHVDGWQHLGPRDDEAVRSALARARLEELADRPAAELSQGEQKRVHLGRVLAQGAAVLVLDEAAAHLDVGHAAALYELVRAALDAETAGVETGPERLKHPRACLAVVHDLEAARRYADRVVLLKAGRVLAAGPPAEVMTPEHLGAAFDTRIELGAPAFVARGRLG